MPRFQIERQCNGHTDLHQGGAVELVDLAHAGAHAVAAAPEFHDLVPGERRECAFEVRDSLEGWRLKIELVLCLEPPERADGLDTGLLE